MYVDLVQYLWILWLALVILFVVIELLTLDFTFLMIAAGTLIGGLGANLLGLPWWAQILGAALLSVLFLFLIRPALLIKLHKRGDPTKSNIDALYGQGARVMRDFSEGQGVVKLDNGETWTARLSSTTPDAVFVEGDRAIVTRIDGAIAEVAALPTTTGDPADERKDHA